MNPAYTDSGIIIRQIDYGEADKFVKVLTQEHGLVDLLAKGARRLTSRKSSHLDNLNLIRFSVGRSSMTVAIMNQAETVNAFTRIKQDLKLVRTCFYIAEVLDQVLPENQPDPNLFRSFSNYLTALNQVKEGGSRGLTVNFQLYLIKYLGFPPPPNNDPQTLVDYFQSLIDKKLYSLKIK